MANYRRIGQDEHPTAPKMTYKDPGSKSTTTTTTATQYRDPYPAKRSNEHTFSQSRDDDYYNRNTDDYRYNANDYRRGGGGDSTRRSTAPQSRNRRDDDYHYDDYKRSDNYSRRDTYNDKNDSHYYHRNENNRDDHPRDRNYHHHNTSRDHDKYYDNRKYYVSYDMARDAINMDPSNVPHAVSKTINYDHSMRPNRPRIVASGWDVVGTQSDVDYVTKYLTSFAHIFDALHDKRDLGAYGGNATKITSMGAHEMANYKEKIAKNNHNVDNSDLLLSLLPVEVGGLGTDASTINSNNNDNSNDDLLASLLPSEISNIDDQHKNYSNQNAFSRTNSNYNSSTYNTSNNQIDLSQDGIVPSRTRPHCFDVAHKGKAIKATTYIAGYPSTIPIESVREQIPQIITRNIALLLDRVPPLPPEHEEQTITYVNAQPGFCFLEFGHPDDAGASLSLHGLQTTIKDQQGQDVMFTLAAKPPKNLVQYYSEYPPKRYTHPSIQQYNTNNSNNNNNNDSNDFDSRTLNNINPNNITPTIISSVTGKPIEVALINQHKVYIGNVSQTVSEPDLRALFTSPALLHFHYINNHNGTKIYAFASYSSREDAEKQIAMFNGHYIGGRTLVVKFASSFSSNNTTNTNENQNQNQNQTPNTYGMSNTPNNNIGGNIHGGTGSGTGVDLPFPTSQLPTEFIVFYNIADIDEFNEEKDDIILDIVEVCEQSSKIDRVKYKVEAKPNERFPDGDVCVFLSCQDAICASHILNRWHGKKFGGKTAKVKFIDSVMWNSIQDEFKKP